MKVVIPEQKSPHWHATMQCRGCGATIELTRDDLYARTWTGTSSDPNKPLPYMHCMICGTERQLWSSGRGFGDLPTYEEWQQTRHAQLADLRRRVWEVGALMLNLPIEIVRDVHAAHHMLEQDNPTAHGRVITMSLGRARDICAKEDTLASRRTVELLDVDVEQILENHKKE